TRFGVSANSPFGLLSHVGEDCAGAVQFVRPERLAALGPGGVEWLDEESLRDRIERLRFDPASWLDTDSQGQFSLAGAQAKFALIHEEGRWGEPYGAVPTTHIIKPPAGRFADQDLNEHLCLSAAANAGLTVARSKLVHFVGERAVAVERYDRLRTAQGWVRVHQEDCCQALGVPPDRKYQSDGGPGTAAIARLLRQLLPGEDGDRALSDFVDAVAFNWLAGGTDAHAKNFSILLSGSQVRLAPLYDLVSALPYVAGPRDQRRPGEIRGNLALAMKIGDNSELGMIRREDWTVFAAEVGIASEVVLGRVDELAELVPQAFESTADDDDVAATGSQLPGRLVERVKANVSRCRSALAGRPVRRHRGRAGSSDP
ncbi:MAG TPA: HipA domain-containing protein, partial [Acidimicrobiales bacterium]|nr:HipA domain-containing protein [Acidimicrobiales bacterium]